MALNETLQDLLERFRAGKTTALARAISLVEDERAGFQDFLHEVLKAGPSTARVGFTGPPGAGKSSIVATLATAYRGRGEDVGIVAVDPTSPFSGGALLGDRIRMNDLATDAGIFIRSMATRGSLGGLATTTKEVMDLMDAFGFARVLVESVGVGQTELEITAAADTVVVVLVPESGDAIQAMKAGLMEIADVFVVNKADRPGAERLVREIRQAIHLRSGSALRDVPAHHGVDLRRLKRRDAPPSAPADPEGTRQLNDAKAGWDIPVLKTVAQSGEGLEEVLDAADRHRAWLLESGEMEVRRRARARIRVQNVVDRELRLLARRSADSGGRLERGLDDIQRGAETPYSVARTVLEELLGSETPR
ncbi:MAG: methylmalonyl Co-A mutase-associated GTPase MeaB [Gemmatimonadetes bacterium]|nr:methylmalonyl Co-A mutase-associated GTPase MeaB [Gemmatimonadota bacterium]